MYRRLVSENLTLCSIILFFFIYSIIMLIKPKIIFKDDNSLREFGIGYKNKTIIPAWLMAILIAILSYFGLLYYLAYPKLKY